MANVYETVYPFQLGLSGFTLWDPSTSPLYGQGWDYIIVYNTNTNAYGVDDLVGLPVKGISDTDTWLSGEITGNSASLDVGGGSYHIGINCTGALQADDDIAINYWYDYTKMCLKDGVIKRIDPTDTSWQFFFPVTEARPESFENWLGIQRTLMEGSVLDVFLKIGRIMTIQYPPPRPPVVYLDVFYYNETSGEWEWSDIYTLNPNNTVEQVDENIQKLYPQDQNFRGIVPLFYIPTGAGAIGLDFFRISNVGYRPSYDKHRVFGYIKDATGAPLSGEVLFTPLFNKVSGVGLIERNSVISVTLDENGYFDILLVEGQYKVEFPSMYSEAGLVEINEDVDLSDIF